MKFSPDEKRMVHIKNIEVQDGRAAVELTLPDCCEGDSGGYFHIYLWDEKGLPVFECTHPVVEEEPCVLNLLHPHLWEGVENPYLYRLEVYAQDRVSEGESCRMHGLELMDTRLLALRTLQEIPGKGWFLNGLAFSPKCVQYPSIGAVYNRGEQEFWSRFEQRLCSLAKMGANMIALTSVEGMSDRECILLREYCDRYGLILYVGEICEADKASEQANPLRLFSNDDTCVMGDAVLGSMGLPTEAYYRYKARWSKEPFVYISAESFSKQSDGSYRIMVYSNRKKIVLLVNGKVFAFREDGPEFSFQDMQIKSFPVSFAAEAEECSMTVVCYRAMKNERPSSNLFNH